MTYGKDNKSFLETLGEILALCVGRIFYGFFLTTGVILALRVASILP